MGTIVVGIDGSPSARAAVQFAVQEARLRGGRLRLVSAWNLGSAAYGGAATPPPPPTLPDDLERAARSEVDEAAARLGETGIEIETVAREGQPAQILIEEARKAELLVIGSRGLGGFAGLLLGSVSDQCARHAPCPVVIVRATPASASEATNN